MESGQGSAGSSHGQMVGRIPGNPAGFWVRMAAFLVDGALLLGILSLGLVVLLLTPLREAFRHTSVPSSVLSPALLFCAGLGLLASFLYFTAGESSRDQGTLGKMVLELRVMDSEGRRITPARAAGRFLVKILSFTVLFSGVVMIGFTKGKRGLHDLAADTLVMEPLVPDLQRRVWVGLAAAAACAAAFPLVVALVITFLWYTI